MRSIAAAAGVFCALLLSACSTTGPAPEGVPPGGYRFELYTRAAPEQEPELAVTGVFYLADEPFADNATLLRQRERLVDAAPLSRLERHMLAAGKSNFCLAASPAVARALALPAPVAFSVAQRNPRMVEVLMHHDADWAYAWVLTSDGEGGVRAEGRGEGRLWELYDERIRVIPDDTVTAASCIEFAERSAGE